MAKRKNVFLWKRSNVSGKVPSPGDLLLGEMALNTADVKLYASGTTANKILEIGWDRVSRTGDTMSGSLILPDLSATTITATTFYGDGSNLTGISYIDSYLTGGTLTNSGILNLKLNQNKPDVNIDLKEIKRLMINADSAFNISAGRAYIGNTGASFLSFNGVGGTDEASFNFIVPSDYISGGSFYIKFITSQTNNNIKFNMTITSINNGGNMSSPSDTNISNVTQGSQITWGLVETSQFVPINSTFNKNKNIIVKINRNPNDTQDTFNGTAYVWGLIFEYTGIK